MAEHRDYEAPSLGCADIDPDPLGSSRAGSRTRRRAGLVEPEAMLVSTTAPGAPRRYVSCAAPTSAASASSRTTARRRAEIYRTRVALTFGWLPMHRQVRVSGNASDSETRSPTHTSRSRPRSRQIGAWASPQSAVIEDRAGLNAWSPTPRRASRPAPVRARGTGAGSSCATTRSSSGRAGQSRCTTGCATARRRRRLDGRTARALGVAHRRTLPHGLRRWGGPPRRFTGGFGEPGRAQREGVMPLLEAVEGRQRAADVVALRPRRSRARVSAVRGCPGPRRPRPRTRRPRSARGRSIERTIAASLASVAMCSTKDLSILSSSTAARFR